MIFKSEAQLRKFLLDKCAVAVDATKEKIYDEFANNLNQFYSEYDPIEYIRTYKLLNSLEVTGVKKVGNRYMSRVTAEIYFDTPHYETGEVLLQSGNYGTSYRSDEWIQDVVMKGSKPHGNYAAGTAIWSTTMRNLGRKKGIINLLKQELKRQGL